MLEIENEFKTWFFNFKRRELVKVDKKKKVQETP